MKTTECFREFGSGAALARALNLSRQAIYRWGDEPPPLQQYRIEELTNGKLKRSAHKGMGKRR